MQEIILICLCEYIFSLFTSHDFQNVLAEYLRWTKQGSHHGFTSLLIYVGYKIIFKLFLFQLFKIKLMNFLSADMLAVSKRIRTTGCV